MRGFPFVVGTDIVQISRFNPTTNLNRIPKLARRFLHPAEFSHLETRYPECRTLLHSTHSKPSSMSRNTSEVKCFSDATNLGYPHLRSEQVLQSNADIKKFKSWLAGRWAAKEAARKAWGADIIGYKDVRVQVAKPLSSSSSASVSIVCEPFRDWMEEVTEGLSPENGDSVHVKAEARIMQEGALSISHDGDYVVATVIAEPLKEELKSYFRLRSEEARKAVLGLSQ